MGAIHLATAAQQQHHQLTITVVVDQTEWVDRDIYVHIWDTTPPNVDPEICTQYINISTKTRQPASFTTLHRCWLADWLTLCSGLAWVLVSIVTAKYSHPLIYRSFALPKRIAIIAELTEAPMKRLLLCNGGKSASVRLFCTFLLNVQSIRRLVHYFWGFCQNIWTIFTKIGISMAVQ